MVEAQFRIRAAFCCPRWTLTDRRNVPPPPTPYPYLYPITGSCSFHLSIRCRPPLKSSSRISCCSSGSGGRSGKLDDDHDYIPASLLISETVTHYRMRRRGEFDEEEEMGRWPSPGKLRLPFNAESRRHLRRQDHDLGFTVGGGIGFLRRFQSPTIFLKVSCDGDFLLPIIVGEFAIEKLIDAIVGGDNGDCPDQFHLVRNVAEKIGYQVNMVRITERVVNTYIARLYFSKPGDNDTLYVDIRPSDAINVANRCKVPIYVSKQIVFMDAIRIGYGTGRAHDRKPTYDVSLDSAADGPDSLAEELDLVKNMNTAVKEERYSDAAMWRDKLMELRQSRHRPS